MMAKQTIFCPSCGTENPLTAKFCGNCGFDLTEAAAKAVESANKATYQSATTALDAGRFAEAVQGFQTLGQYADAPAQLQKATARLNEAQAAQREAQYQQANDAFAQGNLQQAAALFSQLTGFKDAAQKLTLVQNAQAAADAREREAALKRKAQQDQQNYDRNYHDALQKAAAATTTATLKPYIDYLGQYRDYQDGAKQIDALQRRYAELTTEEQAVSQKRKRQAKLIGIIVAILLVLGGGGYFAYHQHQTAQAEMQKQVAAQRQTNAKSFDQLDSQARHDLKAMAGVYHANVHDYTYKVKGTTEDYTLVGYSFRGPDKTKDVLPASGTRLYNSVALYRQ